MSTNNNTIDFIDWTIPGMELTKALGNLIQYGNMITGSYVALKGGKPWPITTQLLHINSEVSEAYEVLRNKNNSEGLDLVRLFEELTDIILSATTAINITIMTLLQQCPGVYPSESKLRTEYNRAAAYTVQKVIDRLKVRIQEAQNVER